MSDRAIPPRNPLPVLAKARTWLAGEYPGEHITKLVRELTDALADAEQENHRLRDEVVIRGLERHDAEQERDRVTKVLHERIEVDVMLRADSRKPHRGTLDDE